MDRSGVAPCHLRAEVRELRDLLRWTRVMCPLAAMFGSEAEGQRDIEAFQGLHLPIEPAVCVGTIAVGPAQSGAHVFDTHLTQDLDRSVEPGVLEMKPLTNPERGRVV